MVDLRSKENGLGLDNWQCKECGDAQLRHFRYGGPEITYAYWGHGRKNSPDGTAGDDALSCNRKQSVKSEPPDDFQLRDGDITEYNNGSNSATCPSKHGHRMGLTMMHLRTYMMDHLLNDHWNKQRRVSTQEIKYWNSTMHEVTTGAEIRKRPISFTSLCGRYIWVYRRHEAFEIDGSSDSETEQNDRRVFGGYLEFWVPDGGKNRDVRGNFRFENVSFKFEGVTPRKDAANVWEVDEIIATANWLATEAVITALEVEDDSGSPFVQFEWGAGCCSRPNNSGRSSFVGKRQPIGDKWKPLSARERSDLGIQVDERVTRAVGILLDDSVTRHCFESVQDRHSPESTFGASQGGVADSEDATEPRAQSDQKIRETPVVNALSFSSPAMDDRPHKAHRPAQSGAKAEKKKGKEKQKGFNEKAFAPRSGRRAEREGRRTAERDQTRLHVPLVNRTPDDEPPPVIVAVVGPPGVGKTTLVKSLVRRYTKQTLNQVQGPITVVSGKKKRLTFIECNNDLNSMIDIGKIADLVLLMIDGSYGFEMETFEFLNIVQAHGFPKVIGVLTHLDLIKKAAALRDTKKMLKKRFWTEIYQGAKLFYLSGVLNGRYPDTEILNLSRFISVMKFRPLVFRNSHPYLLADRIEDLTPREEVRLSQGKCDRTVTVYGYLRGTNMRMGTKVHIPGVGDMGVKGISKLGDPCPLPDADSEKRRKLSEKKKLLVHAPMSDVGGVMYDKDAVYINVPGSFTRGNADVLQGEGEKMVMDLQDVDETLEDVVARSHIRLFGSSSRPLAVDPGPNRQHSDSDEEDEDEE
ncbi:hypothetical protein NM688_g4991 [Phlebia brevispora]|uniref:Uncharacterized protein n=1 Tax=Phlebia brevispora TaxID=194682 RepID=A0ACC1T1E3_9APHY|nr:hypothetical protein NM688_g4991 [Phlebia brevispora]